MAPSIEPLWTVARIAEHLKVQRHRVEYIIDSRGLKPVDRAGIARVFDARDVELIARELRRVELAGEGVARGN